MHGKSSTASDEAGRLIVGLDIGTNKVAAIVGEVTPRNELEIKGIGTHASRGMKKGVVVNIESTVQSIQRAVEEAELMAGCNIDSVYAGIAGSHVKSTNSHGVVAVPDREVLAHDVQRVIETAEAMAIPTDQKMLHVLPQEFIIDHQDGVRDPVGMSGVRLEAKVHLVSCAANALQNIKKCIERCGLRVNQIILEQLASSYAVLSDDERELGVCLVDIGGGTSDIAVFTKGAIRHTAVIPVAGDHVTNDIAMALRTPTKDAEDIKIRYGCALAQLVDGGDKNTIEVPGAGDRPPRQLPRQTLAAVVAPRYEELFEVIRAELQRSGYEPLIATGIVLTGGASKMEGVVELAEEIFQLPVSLGAPKNLSGLKDIVRNPIHSTGVGLMLYGMQREQETEARPGPVRKGAFTRMRQKITQWMGDNL